MDTKTLTILLCLPTFIACQSNKTLHIKETPVGINLYLDSQFYSQNLIETEQAIFQLNDKMRTMVRTKLMDDFSAHKKARILLEHLFNEENIGLSYDGNANFTAAQTYQRKSANCLSLTIMAYALADAAKMSVVFKEVKVPEYWVRNGRYNLLTGHVNLLIIDNDSVNNRLHWRHSVTKIDFDPFIAKKQFPSKTVQKNTIMAMFYSNKGAEALVNNDYLRAYKYFKKATTTDNKFSSAWANLGVLYKISGYFEMAEFAYSHAINLKKDNLTSLSNLALLLKMQGRQSEAAPIEEHLNKLRRKNPYYHSLLGDEALFKQSYQQAIQHYKKAIQLDDEQHEFYFGLAKVYYQQGKFTLSKKAMKKALGYTKVKKMKDHYTAKLNFINSKSNR
ncbi:MAG: tetratricopeptide repeat protein [Colwellia sp.]